MSSSPPGLEKLWLWLLGAVSVLLAVPHATPESSPEMDPAARAEACLLTYYPRLKLGRWDSSAMDDVDDALYLTQCPSLGTERDAYVTEPHSAECEAEITSGSHSAYDSRDTLFPTRDVEANVTVGGSHVGSGSTAAPLPTLSVAKLTRTECHGIRCQCKEATAYLLYAVPTAVVSREGDVCSAACCPIYLV
jgi:hypothetical protein